MFHNMKLYTVHTKPGSDVTLDRPLFIREGFSLWAFVFTFIWALSKKCWLFAVAILLANAMVMLASRYGYLGPLSAGVVQFGIQVIVGFTAHDIWRAKLMRQGYIFQDITSGDSLLRAEQRYFDRFVAKA